MALTQWREIRGRMSVAMEVGIEAAILLEDIYYWVNHNREREHNFNEGYYWTVNSYQDFVNRFPCFSVGKIKRLLAQLKTAGFIEARHYRNYDPRNRSLWYRTKQKTAEHYTSLAEAANQRNSSEFDTFQEHKSDLTDAKVKSDLCMSPNRPMHRTESHFPSILTNSTDIKARTEKGATDAAVSSKAHLPEVFNGVEDVELRKVLMAFADERRLHRKPLSSQAATMLLDKLEELAPHDTNKQVEIVKNSIINGWGSFYQLSAPKVQLPGGTKELQTSPRNLYEETMAKIERLESNNGGDNDDVLF